MPALGLALAFVLADASSTLIAAATSSPRPPECASAAAAQEPEFWARARSADRAPYCVALARAHTRLGRLPAEALTLAERAQDLGCPRRGHELLRARALVRLGRGSEAWTLLGPLLGKPGEPALIEDPVALRDIAAAAVAAGDDGAAHDLFRVIAARANLLPDARLRAVVFLETGVLAMARGQGSLPEAELYFDEARRAQVPGLRDLIQAFTALALDRAGHGEQARAAARETGGPWELERRAESLRDLVLPSGELSAAIAILAEGRDQKLADSRWRAYLADARAARGPWAEHAQRKLSAPARGRAR